MIITQAMAQATMPDQSGPLWGQTTGGEIALLVLGALFTIVLLVVFFWVTFRASREKS